MRSSRRLTTRSARKGFTLIELLIVVVIIGILAAVAIPKFANTKDKAYIGNMKSDLKNLSSVQESFFSDSNTYATTAAIQKAPYSFAASNSGVTTILTNSSTGWSATISNPAVKSVAVCAIFSGSSADSTAAAAKVGSLQDNVPVCK